MEEGFERLNTYNLKHKLAIKIFHHSKSLLKEETFSLTYQIRKLSRSICNDIDKEYKIKEHPKHFSGKITNAEDKCSKTMIWLDFSKDSKYIPAKKHKEQYKQYLGVGKIRCGTADNSDKFIPKQVADNTATNTAADLNE